MNKHEVLTDAERADLWNSSKRDNLVDHIHAYTDAIIEAYRAKLTAGVELPPLPEPEALGMDFDKGWDGVRAYGYTDEQVREAQLQAIAADRSRLAGQEAVAWQSMHCGIPVSETHNKSEADRWVRDGCSMRGLYAGPVPAQAEKVEPVEIGAIAAAHDIGYSKKEREDAEEILRLIATIKYLVGIAERGEGRKCRDDETPEQFVLGYVKRLESVDRQTDIYNFASWLTCRNAVIEVGSTCDASPMAEALREYFERHCKQFSTTPPTAPQSLLDAAEKALVSMVDVIAWRQTGLGRPPEQLMLDEVVALRAALQEHGRKV